MYPTESAVIVQIEKEAARNLEILRQIEAGFRFHEYGVDFTNRKREDAMRRLADCEAMLRQASAHSEEAIVFLGQCDDGDRDHSNIFRSSEFEMSFKDAEADLHIASTSNAAEEKEHRHGDAR